MSGNSLARLRMGARGRPRTSRPRSPGVTASEIGVAPEISAGRCAGFTLVEMLVVIAILLVLAVLASTALRGVNDGQKLTSAAGLVAAQLEEARQLATAMNRPVVVRFYRYKDNATPGGSDLDYRALQVFTVETAGLKPAGRVERLPTPMQITPEPTFSSILDPSKVAPADQERKATAEDSPIAASAGVVGGPDRFNYWFTSLRFRADGSAALDPSAKWFVTVEDPRERAVAGKARAKSATIQIDPISGVIRTLRPG